MKYTSRFCALRIIALMSICFGLSGSFFAYCQLQVGRDGNNDSKLTELLPKSASEKIAVEKPTLVSDLVTKVTVKVERDYVPIDHMRGLLVNVTNQSKYPILVDCDAAKVVNADKRNSASLKELELAEGPRTGVAAQIKSDTKATVTAAFTVGAVQTIEGIKLQHGPILNRYGADEKRRQNEVTRFGKRLLWPDESTTGIIYFNTDKSFVNAMLEVPISMPFGSDKASVATISTRVDE